MKKIEFTSNYGNFAYRMTAEIGEEVNPASEALCLQGLANICYRVAGSSVDKALGVKERKSVLFSDADGERINAAVSAKLTEIVKKTPVLASLNMSFAVTGQHEFGAEDAGGTKAATEQWTVMQSWDDEKFQKVCKGLGIDPEAGDDDKAVAAIAKFHREHKRAALEKAKKDAEAAMAAMAGA